MVRREVVRLGRHCQMVLPVSIRKQLGVGEGDEVLVWVKDKAAVIVPKPKDPARHLWGLHREIWQDVNTDEYVRRERDSWES